MFTIRNEQLAAFSRYLQETFEDQMLPVLQKALPQRSNELGEERLRLIIRQGIAKARSYRIVEGRDTARYICLMVLLREDFDTHPDTPWARTILANTELHPVDKLRRLFAGAAETIPT